MHHLLIKLPWTWVKYNAMSTTLKVNDMLRNFFIVLFEMFTNKLSKIQVNSSCFHETKLFPNFLKCFTIKTLFLTNLCSSRFSARFFFTNLTVRIQKSDWFIKWKWLKSGRKKDNDRYEITDKKDVSRHEKFLIELKRLLYQWEALILSELASFYILLKLYKVSNK